MPEPTYLYRLVYGLDNFPKIEAQLRKRHIKGSQFVDKGHQRLYRVPIGELGKLPKYNSPSRGNCFLLPTGDKVGAGGYILENMDRDDPKLTDLSERGWQDVSESSAN